MAKNREVVNVYLTNSNLESLSRTELLSWANRVLYADFMKIEELCTGAAYCQLMHMMFPWAIVLRRVKFTTNLEHENIKNFKLVQAAFNLLNVQKHIPIETLSKGKFYENFEFLQWFKKFYDANCTGNPYDALAARNGQPMGYGTSTFTGGSSYCGRWKRACSVTSRQTLSDNQSSDPCLRRTTSVLTTHNSRENIQKRKSATAQKIGTNNERKT